MESEIFSEEHKRLVSKIKHARLESGLSQTQVAEEIGMTQSHISKIEIGQRKIDVLLLKKLARVYKKSLSYFIN